MSRLLYYLVLKPVSMLPFGILYSLSTFLYWTMYRLAGYRRRVVKSNIRRAFPDKSTDECLRIERAFYRHFFDLLLEGVKLFSLREKELVAACEFENPEIFDPFIAGHKRIIVTSGHYGNWELASQRFAHCIDMISRCIYSPLSDPFLENKLLASRSRFGLQMVSRLSIKSIVKRQIDSAESILFATDQSPANSRSAYWTTFLSQETGILLGTERIAVKYGCPVFYLHYQKPKRGHYRVRFELICEDASRTEYGQVTQAHTRLLERDIHTAPHLWLWTHRRWKRTRPEDVSLHPPLLATTLPADQLHTS